MNLKNKMSELYQSHHIVRKKLRLISPGCCYWQLIMVSGRDIQEEVTSLVCLSN